jgi:quinol monooxygenase YgiN
MAGEREAWKADLERRERDVATREAALAERMEAAQVILDAAAKRDVTADGRDVAAERRGHALDRAQFLVTDASHGYGDDWSNRRDASLDRDDSKDDRKASLADRIALTEDDVSSPRREMIIIAGYELVDAEQRDSIVTAHCDLVTRAREFDGCVHVAITADSVDPERVNSVEVWRDAEAMERWRAQANAPDVELPTFTSVKRYNATNGGALF